MSKHAIAFVTDVNYLAPTLIACLTLKNSEDRFIFVTTDDDEVIAKAQSYLDEKSYGITVCPAPQPTAFENKQTIDHISLTGYGRYLLPELLGDKYERVLHMDSDGIAGPIAFDLDIDLEGYAVGAVARMSLIRDGLARQYLDDIYLDQNKDFLNSGVLLIDTAEWRAQDITAHMASFDRSKGKFCLEDQHTLNGVLAGACKQLDPTWNVQPPAFSKSKLMANARFYHFSGAIKPWHGNRWKHGEHFMAPYAKVHGEIPLSYGYAPSTTLAKIKRWLRPAERALLSKTEPEFDGWLKRSYPEWA